MSSLQVQTPPAAEPITLPTLKNHLRVTISDDDALLAIYLQSARETVESESGRSLVNKLYRQSHDHFPRENDEFANYGTGYFYQSPRYAHHHRWDTRQMIKLLRSPLINVQGITYVGTDQAAHNLYAVPQLWLAQNEYELGDQIGDPNGNLQQVTALTETEDGFESESGATAPAWPPSNASIGTTTTDGDLTWTKVASVPANGGDFIFDADSEPGRIVPAYGTFWPLTLRVPNAVQIFFTSGYGNDGAAAPANLKVAVMLTAGISYEHREAVTSEDLKKLDWYDRLIWSERVTDFNPTP